MPSAALAGLWRLLASLIVSTIVYVYWAIGMGLMASTRTAPKSSPSCAAVAGRTVPELSPPPDAAAGALAPVA